MLPDADFDSFLNLIHRQIRRRNRRRRRQLRSEMNREGDNVVEEVDLDFELQVSEQIDKALVVTVIQGDIGAAEQVGFNRHYFKRSI